MLQALESLRDQIMRSTRFRHLRNPYLMESWRRRLLMCSRRVMLQILLRMTDACWGRLALLAVGWVFHLSAAKSHGYFAPLPVSRSYSISLLTVYAGPLDPSDGQSSNRYARGAHSLSATSFEQPHRTHLLGNQEH